MKRPIPEELTDGFVFPPVTCAQRSCRAVCAVACIRSHVRLGDDSTAAALSPPQPFDEGRSGNTIAQERWSRHNLSQCDDKVIRSVHAKVQDERNTLGSKRWTAVRLALFTPSNTSEG